MKHQCNKNKKSTFYFLPVLLCLLIVLFSGCTKKENQNNKEEASPITRSSIKLNTAVTITIYDSSDTSILDSAFELLDYYENLFSRTIETSEISKINQTELTPFQLSADALDIIEIGLEYGEISKGGFDITIEPLSSLWNFGGASTKRPNDDAIVNAVKHVGYKNASLNGNTLTFKKEGMGIDLGAIAKGYIADRIKEHLLERGVKSAMINLGGNVLCVGSKPGGVPFNVGIQKPFADRSETIAVMQLNDVSIVSSGIYERFFTEDDINYHHLLNPETGFPIDNDLISVTIISPLSVDGDCLSTTVFAFGLDEGMKFINTLENIYAVFITSDYQLHYSEGFLENIHVVE